MGACLLVSPTPTHAAPLAGAMSKDLVTQADGNSLVIQVQRRGGRRGGGGSGGGNAGAAVAAGVIGLAIGAIIASEAARQQQGVEYCMQRYRSYNPETGIWIDRRGRPHQCP
ncbi:MAG: BA14K family protein [Rhizobiales bacterium]|nr:BA14K family protein [Hyphomicrobiales bacterium]